MAITYDFLTQGEFLVVNSYGEISSHEDMIEHAENVIDAALRLGLTKILIQSSSLSIQLDPQEASMFAQGIDHLELVFKGFRIATVVAPENIQSRAFIEDALVKRGVMYKKFETRKDAAKWLTNN
ncbi:hypothetical protein [Maridesulfovibrio sp.]|uniref:hypothetical protein n=1 Tax=unclassified Maridesulfovibrio TaxID=2794999 RepID=UPI003B0084E4